MNKAEVADMTLTLSIRGDGVHWLVHNLAYPMQGGVSRNHDLALTEGLNVIERALIGDLESAGPACIIPYLEQVMSLRMSMLDWGPFEVSDD